MNDSPSNPLMPSPRSYARYYSTSPRVGQRILYNRPVYKATTGAMAKVGKWHRTSPDLLPPVGNAKANIAQAVVDVVETKVTMADWTGMTKSHRGRAIEQI